MEGSVSASVPPASRFLKLRGQYGPIRCGPRRLSPVFRGPGGWSRNCGEIPPRSRRWGPGPRPGNALSFRDECAISRACFSSRSRMGCGVRAGAEPFLPKAVSRAWSNCLFNAQIQCIESGIGKHPVDPCHTRELLGWHLSRTGRATTAASALGQALIARFGTLGAVPEPFLWRSDNGLVFTSRHYTALGLELRAAPGVHHPALPAAKRHDPNAEGAMCASTPIRAPAARRPGHW